MTASKPRSRAQRQRQDRDYREGGKYAKVNPCYACDKSAGVDYFSHHLTDTGAWNDIALVLCKRCSKATDHMTDVEDFKAYAAQFKKEPPKTPEGAARPEAAAPRAYQITVSPFSPPHVIAKPWRVYVPGGGDVGPFATEAAALERAAEILKELRK